MNTYCPEGWRISTPENQASLQSSASLQAACAEGKIIEGRAVVCDSAHNQMCIRDSFLPEWTTVGLRWTYS